MDLIDSIKKDKAYIKYKLIVKNWEKEFKTTHSRTPSKFDIKEAASSIKYAYKKYFQLKSALLENSLSICDTDDEPLESPVLARPLEGDAFDILSPQSESNSQPDPLLPALPSGKQLEHLLSKGPNNSEEIDKLVADGLKDKVNTEVVHNAKPFSPFTANLSKKLFDNRKFSLRNPRKASFSKSQSVIEDTTFSEKENNEQSFSQPDETFFNLTNIDTSLRINDCLSSNNFSPNLSHSKSFQETIESVGTSSNKLQRVRHFNEDWLERAAGLKSKGTVQPSTQEAHEKSPEQKAKYGLANINIPSVPMTPIEAIDNACEFVENSESEGEDTSIAKLRPALKKRKIDINHSIDIKSSQDVEPEISVKTANKVNIVKPKLRGKQKNSKVKKSAPRTESNTDDNQPPDITEYMPFGPENDVAPRHPKPETILSNDNNGASKISKQHLQSENMDKIEKKIKDGTLNENFVKINIEKKVFVRGKKGINYSKYKKKLNKDKKALHASMEFPEGGKLTCFKCGESGHMARYCTAHRGDTLLPLESYDDNDMPTLEDMQTIVSKETSNQSITQMLSASIYKPSTVPESFLRLLGENVDGRGTEVKPIYENYQQNTPVELNEALQKFGHTSFRPGQEEAVMRILSGMSTLLILSTGGGKSLCYQLPAYIYSQHYKCITLVISPLVSLMEDQVLSMPDFLKAGCLHNNQPPTQRRKVIQCLKDGEINILLISPEALVSGDSSNGFMGLFQSLPQIAFACIDEVHCVSQWSHNFRPSYLMICRVLREKLNVRCILGLTATASQSTITSVISHIDIPDGQTGVITNPTLPENLNLSVSTEKDKDRALVSLLTSDRISKFNSIIVYCIRRDECERVAAILRSCLQQPGKINMEKSNKRKRMSYIAEVYHAGMSAAQRKKIQKHFMDGTLRIIVATVAFGMGINKADIRCIIHYNMPSSFESYVQEVGRAGRDGQPAFCHVFMNKSSTDKDELLKHIHANTIDRPTIRKLLQKVFIPCECALAQDSVATSSSARPRCKGHEVGIPIDSTVEELDLPSENIATLLCYIELHPTKHIKVHNNAYTMCKIASYGGPKKIIEAAKNCPPLAMAYLLESKKDPDVTKKNIIEFNVIEAAAAIGWESGKSKFLLKNLEWITDGGVNRRSQLKVEFNTLGFRIKAPGDLTAAELDSILDELHETVQIQEKTMLYQLEESHRAFARIGNHSIESSDLSEEILLEKSNELKSTIRNYFLRENNLPSEMVLEERPLDVERVASDARALIAAYKDCCFTGRSIARIFQGISSPNYPAIVWGRCKFWRAHIHQDFYGLMRVATQQILHMK